MACSWPLVADKGVKHKNKRAMKIFVILALTLFVCTQGSAQADSTYHQEGMDLVQYLDVRDFEVSQNCLGDL